MVSRMSLRMTTMKWPCRSGCKSYVCCEFAKEDTLVHDVQIVALWILYNRAELNVISLHYLCSTGAYCNLIYRFKKK